MNTTVLPYTETQPIDRNSGAEFQARESLLDRILKGLVSYTKGARQVNPGYGKEKTFIDENLLDPVMGREISRSLRR